MARRTRGLKSADLYPNFLSGAVRTADSATPNVLTTVQVFTPIPRLKTIGNRATVMELLWIDMRTNADFALADADLTFQMSIGQAPSTILAWNDARVFAEFTQNTEGVIAAGAKTFIPLQPWRYNFQSKDGYGYLLASDSFNATMLMTNGPGAPRVNIVTWKMFYRFVDIPLSEFIGIVQSTQQT